ncbi:MAG: putative tellurium resistance membrane protein TerC [Paraglaciecola sp.]|jgi:predicted tellurium resistance membrane protein TerC
MLGLVLLILIGFMLIAEAAHLAHVGFFGEKVGAVPKEYLYFAIAFSLFVEFLNMILRKPSNKAIQLHDVKEQAKAQGNL